MPAYFCSECGYVAFGMAQVCPWCGSRLIVATHALHAAGLSDEQIQQERAYLYKSFLEKKEKEVVKDV